MQKLLNTYNTISNIISIIESGNIHDNRYKLLIRTLEVSDVENMQRFLAKCKKFGLDKIRIGEIN